MQGLPNIPSLKMQGLNIWACITSFHKKGFSFVLDFCQLTLLWPWTIVPDPTACQIWEEELEVISDKNLERMAAAAAGVSVCLGSEWKVLEVEFGWEGLGLTRDFSSTTLLLQCSWQCKYSCLTLHSLGPRHFLSDIFESLRCHGHCLKRWQYLGTKFKRLLLWVDTQ